VTRHGRELLKTDGKPMVTPCDGLRMASAVGTWILYNHRGESWRARLRDLSACWMHNAGIRHLRANAFSFHI
jgi:hypothetical protein